jgi:hypothetical protein
MAVRLHLDSPLIQAEQLLIYRVLLRDQPAIADLVQSVLGELVQARGVPNLPRHPGHLFRDGGTATETARRLHLSVRAVTHRLDRSRPSPDTTPSTPCSDLPSMPPCSARSCSVGHSATSRSTGSGLVAGKRARADDAALSIQL